MGILVDCRSEKGTEPENQVLITKSLDRSVQKVIWAQPKGQGEGLRYPDGVEKHS